MIKTVSPKRSFSGWKLWRWAKGRKKMIITVLGSIFGYFAISQSLQGLLLGPVFEAVWAVIEYYFKEIRE